MNVKKEIRGVGYKLARLVPWVYPSMIQKRLVEVCNWSKIVSKILHSCLQDRAEV